MNNGFGGFSNPLKRGIKKLFWHILHHHIPGAQAAHTVKLKSNRSKIGQNDDAYPHVPFHLFHLPIQKKEVNYISFDALVGRNSKFLGLTSEQRDELGGVEYRVCSELTARLSTGVQCKRIVFDCGSLLQALRLLQKIVLAYFLLVQLIPMAIFCPIFSTAKYAPVLESGGVSASSGAFMVALTANTAYTK